MVDSDEGVEAARELQGQGRMKNKLPLFLCGLVLKASDHRYITMLLIVLFQERRACVLQVRRLCRWPQCDSGGCEWGVCGRVYVCVTRSKLRVWCGEYVWACRNGMLIARAVVWGDIGGGQCGTVW